MPERIAQPTHTNIHVDVQTQLRQLWRAVRHAGGFDPNENPVIIGASATAGGGSTPTSVTGGAASAVAVGNAAGAFAADSIAIGDTAVADSAGDIAIGVSATPGHTSPGLNTIVGAYASGGGTVHTTSVVALGTSASAFMEKSTAIGAASRSNAVHATALGADARTTQANQVMLGTAADFVEIPGDSSTAPNGLVLTDTDGSGNRWIIQITSGAIVLSAAP